MRRSFRPRFSPARTSNLRDNRSGGAHPPSLRYIGSRAGGRPTPGRPLRLRPEAVRVRDPRGAGVPRHDPAVPAVAAAPADAGIGAITAPIPTGARPTVGIPAVRLAAIDELRRFGARKIDREIGRAHV